MNFNNILIGSADPQRLADYDTKLFGKPGVRGRRIHRLAGSDTSGFVQRRPAQRGPPARMPSRAG